MNGEWLCRQGANPSHKMLCLSLALYAKKPGFYPDFRNGIQDVVFWAHSSLHPRATNPVLRTILNYTRSLTLAFRGA